jgi:hypothetical protein
MPRSKDYAQGEALPSSLFLGGCVLFAALVAALIYRFGGLQYFSPLGVPTASRLLNQSTTVMMTSIALIIPLTANLYTPRLVKVYVTHPIILGGLGGLALGHLCLLSIHYVAPGHPWAKVAELGVGLACLGVLSFSLPFLYALSQFLRPTYFMPRLTRMGIRYLEQLVRGRKPAQNAQNLFQIIDVVANIALTGMARGDRQLVLHALRSLRTILQAILDLPEADGSDWRNLEALFVPGLTKEGQDYLRREGLWPEAYVLAQMLKIMEISTKREHEVLSELAAHLVETALLAAAKGRRGVVELHLMSFNSLMRETLEAKDSRPFMNLTYHYRLLIEGLHGSKDFMHAGAGHLIHYGRMAARLGVGFGLETVIYDMGELLLRMAARDEGSATDLLLAWVGPLWQEALEPASSLRKVGWRSVIRTHWEARSLDYTALAEAIFWHFLSDEEIHREQLEMVLEDNQELNFEFNERLLRFAHMSLGARAKAKAFLEEW